MLVRAIVGLASTSSTFKGKELQPMVLMPDGGAAEIPDLTFLDPDLYISAANTKGETPLEIESEFVCVVCCGVVLDPVECRNCSSLYCKACL